MRFATKFSDGAGMPSGIRMQYFRKLQLFANSAKRQHHAIGSDFCLVMTFVPVGNCMHFLSNVCHVGLSYFLTDKGSAVARTARRLTHTSRIPCTKVLSQKIQIFQETSFCVLQVSLLDLTKTI